VRSGCFLSALLFTIYVVDMDEMLDKAQAAGSVVFANDLVIAAKNEREMKETMRSLGKYVRKKKLEVNIEKTKMMVFNKRKRKSEENEWNWEERKIEEVNEFKYNIHSTKEPRIRQRDSEEKQIR
jgi:16S rRNA G1207 methylase RsmC